MSEGSSHRLGDDRMSQLSRFATTLSLTALIALFGLGCPNPADDDDSVPDDDDVSNDDDSAGDDDDSTEAEVFITLGGAVIAVDRESGDVLSAADYTERGGPIIVYLTTDPADLSDPIAKFVMLEPSTWQTTVLSDGSQIFVVAVIDDNNNRIIEQTDMLREYASNPRTLGTSDLLNLDIYVDLAAPSTGGGGGGGGGGGDDVCSNIEGSTVLLAGVDGEIVITANSADLGVGPFAETYIEASGAFEICVNDERQYTSLLGIHDADANGFFEPSDSIGEAQINPIALGIGDVIGAVIEIPSANPITLPSPPPYVYLDGDVVFPAYTSGDVLVFVSVGNTIYYSSTLPAPGPFTVRAPSNTDDVKVWAVIDGNSDGAYDILLDPYGEESPLDTATYDVQGLLVSIVDPYDNSITGEVTWAGLVSPGDVLQVALLADQPGSGGGAPVAVLSITDPTFPQEYTIPGLLSGTYYVTGYLDVGGDGGGAQPSEAVGWVGGSQGPTPIVLSGESHVTGNDFTLSYQSAAP